MKSPSSIALLFSTACMFLSLEALAQTGTAPATQPQAQPVAPSQASTRPTFGPYLNVGVGGDIAVGGAAYSESDGIPGTGRTARFQFQAEGGTQYFALPVSFSNRQDVTILGVKPRVQYFLAPIESLPNLYFAPGLGFVFNYWHVSSDILDPATNVIELGAQVSIQVQYRFNKQLHVQLTPMALDFNFWRHFDQSQFGGSGNNTLFGLIYNVLLSFGYNF